MKKFFRQYKIAALSLVVLHFVALTMLLSISGWIIDGIVLGGLWVLPENLWIKDQIPPEWWPNDVPYLPPTKDEYDLNF